MFPGVIRGFSRAREISENGVSAQCARYTLLRGRNRAAHNLWLLAGSSDARGNYSRNTSSRALRYEQLDFVIGRKAASYGIQFDPSVYRFDLHESAYRVGVKNSLRKARRVLTAEVSLHSLPSTPESVKRIKVWLSFMRARPWQFLIFHNCLLLCKELQLQRQGFSRK